MLRSIPFGRRRRSSGCRAFTLVELVTAASLMTIMMLGVVQIFGSVTRTASEAQGIHFAQQQLRAVFDRLDSDLRGITREGYLKINSQTFPPVTSGVTEPYHADTLAFVTIGPCLSSRWRTGEPYSGTASEVVYTGDVRTPNYRLRVGSGADAARVDERRGILGRGQWLLTEQSGSASDTDDESKAGFLADLFRSLNAPPLGGTTEPLDRITVAGKTSPGAGYRLSVEPWRQAEGESKEPRTLSRVLASCVSEFCVEVYDEDSDSFKTESKEWTWTTNEWPRAIRVTIAVHHPSDTAPPDDTTKRFRGYAMQETFWLRGRERARSGI